MSSSPHAARQAPARRSDALKNSDSVALWAAVSLLLGILVAVLGFFAVMMWADAHDARDAAKAARAASIDMRRNARHGRRAATGGSASLTSYAGAAPTNADELAAAHKPYPATLPPRRPGPSRTSPRPRPTSPSRSPRA